MILRPKSWSVFQHYKDRCPPWIKLHRDLLNNREFMCLPLASKALAPLLWLLASESKDGAFEADIAELEFRLRISQKEIREGLKPLIDKGFFIDASGVLAECMQVAIPETETETETEKKRERASPNGSRLPLDWTMPEEWESFCQAERPDLSPREVAKRFADYWHGVAGQKGRKADWLATWRNWVRGEKKALAGPSVTVPGRSGPDPTLARLKQEEALVKPMPPEIRAKLFG